MLLYIPIPIACDCDIKAEKKHTNKIMLNVIFIVQFFLLLIL